MHKIIGGLRQQAMNVCRCPSCVTPHSTTSATRRVATVASQSTRTQLLTSTTVLCSGIATAAAYVDADAKTRRRQQWDQAISELQHDVAAATIKNDRELLDKFDQNALVDTDKRWLDLIVDYIPVPQYSRVDEGRLAWNSVYRGNESHLDMQWTPKKIAITNLATKLMKMRFLLLIKDNVSDLDEIYQALQDRDFAFAKAGDTEAGTQSKVARWLGFDTQRIRNYCGHISHQLHRVWASSHSLQEKHPSLGCDLKAHTRRVPSSSRVAELNANLYKIFSKAESRTSSRYLSLALAVDTMNRCNVTPDLHTYNILLAGLMKLSLPHTASIALHAIRHCNLQPNEITLSLALQHYTTANDRAGFERWLGLIRGEANGLNLIGHHGDTSRLTEKAYLKLSSEDPSKIIHLPTPTPMVFSAIMAGKLHFDGLGEALRTCKTMGNEGWFLDMDGLGPLLRDCAKRRDLAGGNEIWQTAIQMRRRAQMTQGTAAPSIPRHVYTAVLDLYSKTESPAYGSVKLEFDEVWPAQTRPFTEEIQLDTPGNNDARLAAIALPSSYEMEDLAKHEPQVEPIPQHSQPTNTTLPIFEDLPLAGDDLSIEAATFSSRLTEVQSDVRPSSSSPSSSAQHLPQPSTKRWKPSIQIAPQFGGMKSLSITSAHQDTHAAPLSFA